MKQPSKQELKDRIAHLELIITRTLAVAPADPVVAMGFLSVEWDHLRGQDLRSADIGAKVARWQELGLSTIYTADELDATPMETADVK